MLLPISKAPENWDENDLLMLCTERIPENQRLDYKRELNLEPPKERRELLKDITSLANSNGGIIIYGMQEEKHPDLGSIAAKLTPIVEPDLIDRATRIVRTNVAPGLQFYLYKIEAEQGGYYIIAYVPESHIKPHAIIWDKRIYYYARRNQDNVPLTEPEIRDMYTVTALAKTSIRQRYADMEKILFDPAPWGSLLLTCMPMINNLEIANTLSIQRDQLNSAHYVDWFNGNLLRPFVDRFEGVNLGANNSFGIKIYESGDITYGMGFHILPQEPLALTWLVHDWTKALRFYSETYSTLGYWGPIRLWFEVVDLADTAIQWTTNGKDRLKIEHRATLFRIDGKVDDLAEAKTMCIPLIRYFLQACRRDWSEEFTEAWFAANIQI
ncbi:helix-turn-helix domain-containing protein [Sporomusa aerivorans]|uniref:AlbA family DNA-binding domain-containing protein n=1 Tax=Sporomusa aerivorans TaxID=204936 RepID=UPI00352A9DE2